MKKTFPGLELFDAPAPCPARVKLPYHMVADRFVAYETPDAEEGEDGVKHCSCRYCCDEYKLRECWVTISTLPPDFNLDGFEVSTPPTHHAKPTRP